MPADRAGSICARSSASAASGARCRRRLATSRQKKPSSSIRPEERLTVERKSMTPQTARLLLCRAGALSVQHETRANQRNRNPDPPRHGPVPVIHEAGARAFSHPRNAHCEAWRRVIPCETIPHASWRIPLARIVRLRISVPVLAVIAQCPVMRHLPRPSGRAWRKLHAVLAQRYS
jgi:hypothetical protein